MCGGGRPTTHLACDPSFAQSTKVERDGRMDGLIAMLWEEIGQQFCATKGILSLSLSIPPQQGQTRRKRADNRTHFGAGIIASEFLQHMLPVASSEKRKGG